MKTVAIYTLGCKTNQYESNAIMQEFIKAGYKKVEFTEKADIYIVNTCTVTSISDKKSRQILRRAKRNNKESILIATGCFAQIAKEKLEEIKEIDIILGNNEKKDIVKYVEEFSKNKTTKMMKIEEEKEYLEFGNTTYTEKTRAVIKIQDGCNNFCTYCIIPYARGRIRSRKLDNIIKEIKEIAKQNIKEVVLTGIQIASYGQDLEENIGLIDLLEEIDKINGIERIRLGSLDPNLITEEFVSRLKKLDKICNHFHLSLQSCSSSVLKRMNRHYDREKILDVVKILRENFEDVIITADIIVGFPGETEEEFIESYETLEKIALYKIHVFQYSKRENTKAANFENQVSPKIKEERSKKVIELSRMLQYEYNKSYIGKILDVLIEEEEDNNFLGHTSNYIYVKVKSKEKNLRNKIIQVIINDAKDEILLGEYSGTISIVRRQKHVQNSFRL